MSCCMAEKYGNWCKEFEPKFEDEKGNKYCIFHAPLQLKIKTPLDFSKALSDYLIQRYSYFIQKINDEHVLADDEYLIDFSGSIFPITFVGNKIYNVYSFCKEQHIRYGKSIGIEYLENIYKLKHKFSPPKLIFDHSKFHAGLDFQDILISQKTSFNNCLFFKNTTTSFTGSSFNGNTSFLKSYFLGNTDFRLIESNQEIDFRYCKFKEVSFLKANFENVNFNHANFLKSKEDTVFSLAKFNNNVTFSSSKFYNKTKFNGCQFEKTAAFGKYEKNKEAKFTNTLEMQGCTFNGIAYFCNCKFDSKVDFSNSKFNNLSNFYQSKLSKEDITLFVGCKFYGYANFCNIDSGRIRFNIASFYDQVDFSEMNIHGNFSLFKTSFEKHVTFNDSKFFKNFLALGAYFQSWSLFRNVIFKKYAFFKDAICDKKIILEKVKLDTMPFTNVNIESFKFVDCKWGEKKLSPVYDEEHKSELNIDNSQLEEIYRRLKKNAKDSADEMQSSYWHYREKKMQKKNSESAFFFPSMFTVYILIAVSLIVFSISTYMTPIEHAIAPSIIFIVFAANLVWDDFIIFKKHYQTTNRANFFLKISLNIYDWISGFGEKPEKALFILLSMLLISLIVTPYLPELKQIKSGNNIPTDNLSTWLWYLPLTKIQLAATNGINYFWKALINILITIQAALFAFALRNKLRR